MVQFIDFYVTAHNDYSREKVVFALENLKSLGTVKKWTKHADGETTHFEVNGTWTAYSTVSAIMPKTKQKGDLISISIEHFEDDL